MAVKLKRGIFFTTIAIVLVIVIILGFFVQHEYRLRNKMYVIETRVETINDFIKSIEKDLSRGLYITSFRAMLGIESSIGGNGTFLNSIDFQFNEVLLNGTLNKKKISEMENTTFTDWKNKIQDEAGKIDILANITIMNLTVFQQDPWHVTVNSLLLLQINDRIGTAKWVRNENVTIQLNVEGFEDPLYSLNTYGKIVNLITKANSTDFSIAANLINHINKSYYMESSTGPSFLMRLEGKTSNSPYGIESLVNLNKFFSQNIPTLTRSNVDYIYFGNATANSCVVDETYLQLNWFRLDNEAEPYNHLDEYEAHCVA